MQAGNHPPNHCSACASGTPIGFLGHSLLPVLRGEVRRSIGMPDDDLFILPGCGFHFRDSDSQIKYRTFYEYSYRILDEANYATVRETRDSISGPHCPVFVAVYLRPDIFV
jgi:hypothetical protein